MKLSPSPQSGDGRPVTRPAATVRIVTDTTWLDATAQAELVRDRRGEPDGARRGRDRAHRAGQPAAQRGDPRRASTHARAEAAGDLPDGPFRGVPMLLKDLGCHVAGDATALRHVASCATPTCAGRPTATWPGSSAPPGSSSSAAPTCRSSARTVTTEPVAYGPTRNPWDPAHSTGGSSGGSAAAVAAGMVPVAHASDGGGSIRIPASECGLVGLKPTRARVSQGPDVGEGWAGATTDGVVTRTVRDAAAVLDAIAGPMPGDPYIAAAARRARSPRRWAPPAAGCASGCWTPTPGSSAWTTPTCRAAVDARRPAARVARLRGRARRRRTACSTTQFPRLFGATIAADTALTSSPTIERRARAARSPTTSWNRATRSTARSGSGCRADYLGARPCSARGRAGWPRGGRRRSRAAAASTCSSRRRSGAPPPELGWFTAGGPKEEGRRIGSFIPYTAQFNMTGQPAISLPLHWTADGLPVGVQLVAAYGREDVLVRVAAALEEAAPWADRRPEISA